MTNQSDYSYLLLTVKKLQSAFPASYGNKAYNIVTAIFVNSFILLKSLLLQNLGRPDSGGSIDTKVNL